MRITWVTRSFLDYRIPVYKELANSPGVEFTLLTSAESFCTPHDVREKARIVLKNKVVFLSGERCIGKPYSPDQRSNSVFRIFYQPGLVKKIKETHPDVIITDAFNHWTLPVLWLRTRHNFKHIVCYERTAHTERNAAWLKRLFISSMSHWVDAVHYNGVLCRDFLLSLGYPENKLKPGNMAVDIENFSRQNSDDINSKGLVIRKQYKIDDRLVFLYVGKLIPRKGIAELLHAWKIWNQKNGASAQLLLVGNGSQEEELRHYCAINHLQNVIFAGSHDYSDLKNFYSIADVFIIPTIEDNWSLVVSEAMASKLPIMISIYNGCYPELVHPENGWLFDPLNQESIISALQDAYLKRNELSEMGQNSLRIISNFSPQKIVKSILKTCDLISH